MLRLEVLEDRLVPASFHWVGGNAGWDDNVRNWWNDTVDAVATRFPGGINDNASIRNGATVTLGNGISIGYFELLGSKLNLMNKDTLSILGGGKVDNSDIHFDTMDNYLAISLGSVSWTNGDIGDITSSYQAAVFIYNEGNLSMDNSVA